MRRGEEYGKKGGRKELEREIESKGIKGERWRKGGRERFEEKGGGR